MQALTPLGSLIGWVVGFVTNLVQLAIWLRQVLLRRRRQAKLQNKVISLEQELSRTQDRAEGWRQMTYQAALMMRVRCPKTYEKFAEFYGGVEEFSDWWCVPDQPEQQVKLIRETLGEV